MTVGRELAITDSRVVEESVALPTVTTTDESNDGHADEFGDPGFGVPIALVALLAELALARRD